jgi:hypothetical protein
MLARQVLYYFTHVPSPRNEISTGKKCRSVNWKAFGRNHSGYLFKSGPNKTQLTVLVNKHAERDAVGIKSIQKILDVTANEGIKPKLLLVFNHSLSHCRNHIIVSVSNFNQDL